jgi:BASS family bile acid:Na+ symporter
MSFASLILLVLKTSVMLLVFGMGLRASRADISYLFRRPRQLLRSFLSMNVVMPLLAATLAISFDLRPPVKIALLMLAISPVPPLLPKRLGKSEANGYMIGLLFGMAVIAVIFIPAAIAVLDRLSPASLHVPFLAVLNLALITVLVPLSAGVLVRRAAGRFAERIAKPVSLVAAVMLVLGLLPVLAKTTPAILSLVGNGTIVAFIVFVVVGLAAGHFLGGPVAEDRSVLALATASRHPAIAATIAIANFPEQKLVFPAILLYFLVNILLCLPYMVLVRRQPASRPATSAPSS